MIQMEIPEPQSESMACPRCKHEARFVLPYQMLKLSEDELDCFRAAMKTYPHRLSLELLSDRQIVWYFPDLYEGPWNGWEARFGVCVCGNCGLRRITDWLKIEHSP